ncbi:restriction endonuclease subunit S [bacterium]|nr:restriction endonuclease subunit S [bacterium]
MTPQELKNSILQMAIEGKLVEQRLDEGTGEYTLNKHGFDVANPPFQIPDTWKWQVLGSCCEMYTGNSISASEKKAKYVGLTDGYDYIATKNISFEQKIEYDNGVRIPFENSFKRAYKNSILMCIEGGSAGRKIGILDRDVCFGNKLCMFQAHGILNIFLFYYLQSVEFKKLFSENMTGIIGGVSIKKLKETLIPLPPLAEQKRIVAKIEELLPYIDKYEQAYTKLETLNNNFPTDMQKSILQYAIEGKLVEQRLDEGTGEKLYKEIRTEKRRLIKEGKIKKEKPLPEISEEEKPFDIPESWMWARLGELGRYKKGPFGSALTKNIFVPKGNDAVKVYEQKNAIQKNSEIGEYYIKRAYFESKMSGFEVYPGDIIVSCAGTIGETYVLPENIEQGIINQALMRMQLFQPIYKPYFLVFFDVVLKQDARSASKGSAIKNIPPFKVFKNYLFPLPPLAEQKRIVAQLEKILPLCENLKK